MARRRRRGAPRPPRRSSRFRTRMYVATCSVCGQKIKIPVEPPADVALTCVNCLRAEPAADAGAGSES